MKTLLIMFGCLLALTPAFAAEFKIGLVLDRGGKDDKSFNTSAFEGATKAKNELKAMMKYVEATDDNSFEPLLRSLAQKNFDIIIAVGVSQADAVKKIAAQFPKSRFTIIDAEVNAPNVQSIVFEEHEGSYLVGAIAALTSKTGKVGFIGGMDIPLIRRFAVGYTEGAKKINSKVQVISNYVGVTPDSWSNPAKAKELALTQYQAGADVIFHAAGASGTGLFDAAEERNKYAIGVDSNQNWVKPGHVLTSMIKRVDNAVYMACKDAKDGNFKPGVERMGLSNGGIDYSKDEYNDKILAKPVILKADELKKDIISGKIKVSDYYKSRK